MLFRSFQPEKKSYSADEFFRKYPATLYLTNNTTHLMGRFRNQLGEIISTRALCATLVQTVKVASPQIQELIRIAPLPDSEILVFENRYQISSFVPLEVISLSEFPQWQLYGFQKEALMHNPRVFHLIPEPSCKLVTEVLMAHPEHAPYIPPKFLIPAQQQIDQWAKEEEVIEQELAELERSMMLTSEFSDLD